jgi:hypothetical protein
MASFFTPTCCFTFLIWLRCTPASPMMAYAHPGDSTHCMHKIYTHLLLYFYFIFAVSKSPAQMGLLSVKNASVKFSRLGTFNWSGTVGGNPVPKL